MLEFSLYELQLLKSTLNTVLQLRDDTELKLLRRKVDEILSEWGTQEGTVYQIT
jgi:hypothetical protein